MFTVFHHLTNHIAFLSPFDIKEDVKKSWDFLLASLDDFRTNANFSEILQNIKTVNDEVPWLFFWPKLETSTNLKDVKDFKKLHESNLFLKNLIISDQTQQYLNTINVAVIGFFENAQVKDIFKVNRLPSNLNSSLSQVTESMNRFAKELNFTEILNDGIFPSNARYHLQKAESSLLAAIADTDPKELYETTILMPAHELKLNSSEEVLVQSMLSNPFQFIMSTSSKHMNESMQWKQVTSSFISLAWRHIVTVSFLLFVIVPLVFILRAALQDGCLWLVTRRYKFVIPSEQRSVSGWMSVAAISGLTMAVAEAFVLCCILFNFSDYDDLELYSQNLVAFGLLIFQGLKGAPIRAATHMRIAEAVAEVDILKSGESGFRRGMIVSALVNGAFSMWWIYSIVVFLLFPVIGSGNLLLVPPFLADLFFVYCSISWGRRICRRMVAKEQRVIEERDRKED